MEQAGASGSGRLTAAASRFVWLYGSCRSVRAGQYLPALREGEMSAVGARVPGPGRPGRADSRADRWGCPVRAADRLCVLGRLGAAVRGADLVASV